MSEAFNISGESSDITAGPAPQLQGLFVPGIDNPLAVDGFGIVTPWGGGRTARRYGDYGIPTEISNQSTQLNDLASSLIPAEGGAAFNLEGLVGPQGPVGPPGPQGPPGVTGITSLPSGYVLPINSNFLPALPHNIDQINALGTEQNQLVYTQTYAATREIGTEDLGSGTTDGDTLGLSDYGDQIHWEERIITISPAVDVVVGQEYIIVVRAPDAPSGHYAYIFGRSQLGGDYAYGDAYTSDNAGVTWERHYSQITYKDYDIRFEAGSTSYTPTYSIDERFTGMFGISGDNWKGQSFTAEATESISSIKLIMCKAYIGYPKTEKFPGIITVSLRDVTTLYSEATWAETDLTSAGRALLDDANAAAQADTLGLGTGDSPTWTGATFSGLTASSLVATDADKALESVAKGNLTEATSDVLTIESGTGAVIGSGTTIQVGLAAPSDGDTTHLSTADQIYDFLVAGYQPLDAGLTSLAGLTYAAAAFVKMTGADTFALRTIAQTKTDLSLNLVENTAHSTDAHTMTIDGRDVSADGTKLDGIEALADVTATAETSHADVVVDGDFGSNGILNRTGAGVYSILALGTDVQAYHANLAAIAGGTWTGAASITTLGTISTVGNITIADGGTIGQAAGPILTFNDTTDKLTIGSCNVDIGRTNASTTLIIATTGAGNYGAGCTLRTDDCEIFFSAFDDAFSSVPYFAGNGVFEITSGDLIVSTFTAGTDIDFLTGGRLVGNLRMKIADAGIFMYNLKSGTDQANAGAAANELYQDTDDNTIKIGV